MALGVISAAVERYVARDPGFIGRAETLKQCTALLHDAQAGHGGALLLAGPFGIGKTRTAIEVLDRAHSAGMQVLRTRCAAAPYARPLGPFADILRQQLAGAPKAAEPSGAELPPEVRAALELPATDAAWALEPQAARVRLLLSMRQALLTRVAPSGLALLIDDLELADTLSLLLLRELAADLDQHPVLLIITVNEAESAEATKALIQALERSPVAQTVRLGGLNLEETTTYLERALPLSLGSTSAEPLQRATSGNPLILDACVRESCRRGEPIDLLGSLTELPATAASGARLRILGLTPSCQLLLCVTSVFGSEAEAELLRFASGFSDAQFAEALAEAISEGILVSSVGPRARIAFTHRVFEERLYASLPASRRASLHETIADVLERRFEANKVRPEVLAFHYHRALNPAHADKLGRFAELAASDRYAHHAYEECAEYLRLALDSRTAAGVQPDRRSAELLIALLRAEYAASAFGPAQNTFARLIAVCREIAAPELATKGALCALTTSSIALAALPAGQALPGLVSSLPPSADRIRARALSWMAGCAAWPSDARKRMATQAAELAYRTGDSDAIRISERALVQAVAGPGDPRALLARSEAELRRPETIADPRFRSELHLARYVARLTLGEPLGIDEELDGLRTASEQLRDPIRGFHVERLSLERELWSGHWDAARERLSKHRARGRRLLGGRADFFHAIASFQWARLRGSPMGYLAADVERMERDAKQAGGAFRSAFALFIAHAGRLTDAQERLNALARNDFEIIRAEGSLEPLVYLAELAAVLEHKAYAQRIEELLRPSASLCGVSTFGWYLGAISHSLGLLARVAGHHDQAIAHFEDALRTHERMGARPLCEQTKAAIAALTARAPRSQS